MQKIITQDCYIETYHEGDGAFNRELAMMLKMGFLEQYTNMVVMTKEDFEKAIGEAFDAGQKFANSLDDLLKFNYRIDKTEYISNLF